MNATMTISEIIHSASSLENSNFENLYQKLSVLRRQRNTKVTSESEDTLLAKINKGFDEKN